MKIAVIGNGSWNREWGRLELAAIDFLVAADGGANHALQAGRYPDALIGDLDSVTPENIEACRRRNIMIRQYPREKDETDLELALEWAVSRLEKKTMSSGYPELWLYGATGGRVDHLLGNLALLLNFWKRGYRIRLRDPLHEIFVVQGREVLQGRPGQELSLIPVTEQARVTTEGLYYPLNGDVILQDSPRGISNVFVNGQAVVQVEKGIVLLVLLA